MKEPAVTVNETFHTAISSGAERQLLTRRVDQMYKGGGVNFYASKLLNQEPEAFNLSYFGQMKLLGYLSRA